jgi:hypothetical protein
VKTSKKKAAARTRAPKREASTPASPKKRASQKAVAPRGAKVAPARPAAKKATTAARPAPRNGLRADLGAPIDGFFAQQPAQLQPVLAALRQLVEEAAPSATSSLKWGMPFFKLNGETLCAIGSHKAHVNLILPGPDGTYADPEGRLRGTGTTGRHLKLTKLADLPRDTVRGWLKIAVKRAQSS